MDSFLVEWINGLMCMGVCMNERLVAELGE